MAGTLVVATIKFTDRDRYDRYAAEFPSVFRDSGGEMLAADETPTPLDGDGSGTDKIVVIRFENEAEARGFLESPDYRRIAEDRDAGANVNSWLVKTF